MYMHAYVYAYAAYASAHWATATGMPGGTMEMRRVGTAIGRPDVRSAGADADVCPSSTERRGR